MLLTEDNFSHTRAAMTMGLTCRQDPLPMGAQARAGRSHAHGLLLSVCLFQAVFLCFTNAFHCKSVFLEALFSCQGM